MNAAIYKSSELRIGGRIGPARECRKQCLRGIVDLRRPNRIVDGSVRVLNAIRASSTRVQYTLYGRLRAEKRSTFDVSIEVRRSPDHARRKRAIYPHLAMIFVHLPVEAKQLPPTRRRTVRDKAADANSWTAWSGGDHPWDTAQAGPPPSLGQERRSHTVWTRLRGT